MASFGSARISRASAGCPPAINVRYFYTTPLEINDPLSPFLPPATIPASTSKQVPRPFSPFDNAALENSWLDVRQNIPHQPQESQTQKPYFRPCAGSTISHHSGEILDSLQRFTLSETNSSASADRLSSSPDVQPREIPLAHGACG